METYLMSAPVALKNRYLSYFHLLPSGQHHPCWKYLNKSKRMTIKIPLSFQNYRNKNFPDVSPTSECVYFIVGEKHDETKRHSTICQYSAAPQETNQISDPEKTYKK